MVVIRPSDEEGILEDRHGRFFLLTRLPFCLGRLPVWPVWCPALIVATACSYVPVTKKGYWQIDMEDVTVSGQSVTSVKSAILDSGTSLLVGPSEDVKAIASKVVGAFSFSFLCVFFSYFCFVCYLY